MRSSGPRLLLALTAVLGALPALVTGCSTIGDDFRSLGDSLTPVSPSEAARMMVDPYDPDNRRRGTVLISNAPFGGSEQYAALYRDRAKYETDPLVRAVSIAALGRHGTPQDAVLIAQSLDFPSFQVRWEAAKALQRLHNPEVVRELLRALDRQSEDVDVRIAAAVALGQYPEDRVFQGLVAALDQTELAVNLAAEGSLHTLTGEDFGPDATAWLRWYAATTDPFAGKLEYLYPTYQRDESFWEKLAFWSTPQYEEPSPPTGLGSTTRRTYDEDEPANHEAGG